MSHVPDRPRQPRVLRGPMLLLGWAWVALSVAYALVGVIRGVAGARSTDFVAFQTAGRLLGESCMYCPATQYRVQLSMLGKPSPAGMVPFIDPPPVAWFMRPFAQLPLTAGLLAFDALALMAMILSGVLLYRLIGPTMTAPEAALLSAAAAFLLPGSLSLAFGNWDGLCLLITSASALLLWKDAGLSAGMVLSLALVKPQLVWLVIPALVVARRWRFVAGFATGALGWTLATVAMVGLDGVRQWIALVDSEEASELSTTAGIPAFTPGPVRLGYVTGVALALLAIFAMWRFRRMLMAHPVTALGAGITASLLCSPHLFEQDFLLLAIPIAYWARHAPRTALTIIVTVGAASLLDQIAPMRVAHMATIVVLAGAVLAGVCARDGARNQRPASLEAVAP